MHEHITQLIGKHIESSMTLAEQLIPEILQVGLKLADKLMAGGKVLICAQGRAYVNGLHFVNALLHCHGVQRPPLPALMLGGEISLWQTASCEGQMEQLYTWEIQAIAHAQDVLFILSVSGASPALLQAIHAAKEKEIPVVLLVDESGAALAEQLGTEDSLLKLPTETMPCTLEMQLMTLHAICEVIEQTIFKAS
jgi:D-sedoheptulose 7-phosphate isomerase